MEDVLIHIDIKKTLHSSNGLMTLEVTCDLSTGTLAVLFGPSGAGKTTLLRILAGLTRPDSGTIRFGETTWYDSDRKIDLAPQQRSIGFMFQDYALFPNMSVEQNILYGQSEKDRAFAGTLLDALQLTDLAGRKPMHLSGGQKQRVALARALARKPQLLLLDEPLSALDAAMRTLLQDEIARVHRLFGTTTLMVSHDLNEVFRLARHVICLEHGKITAVGGPQQVFSETSISGKFQATGQIAAIEKHDVVNIVTVVTGNSVLKVIAFDNDIIDLSPGDRVLVFSKAFNPIIQKLH
jgi:molybdate transport system ATP-binding protein